MYDFYFGEKEEIFNDEVKFLTSVKRMMPRWCNSIPDSEMAAIYNDLMSSNIVSPDSDGVIVETGCGASTLVLAYFAFKYSKKLYTWDPNQNKLSYIRSIMVDAFQKLFDKPVHEAWVYVPYVSNSKELGIGILKELNYNIDFGFYDSEHTAEVLMSEIKCSLDLVNDGAVIALDDANYNYIYKNTAYINIMRKKLGLKPVSSPDDNVGDAFYELVQKEIVEKYPSSNKIDDTYKHEYKDDIFWGYYESDRALMHKLGMEKMESLDHRYDSFKICKK